MPARKQDTAQLVKDALREVLADGDFPQCALEKQHIAAIEELSKKLSIIITGNGKPEDGLVMQVSNVKGKLETLSEQLKERRTREWSFMLIGLGLLATSIWNLLAL